ncbi:hypothetical protein HDU86_004440 [Geranomyces michiganensis]|nr:hypothetical protein HDU86_004440 [Geranomyces michiganensis]
MLRSCRLALSCSVKLPGVSRLTRDFARLTLKPVYRALASAPPQPPSTSSSVPNKAPTPPKAQPLAPLQTIKIPIVLDELDIEESFVKGSGPGGQKINKCRHRVQLRHIPTNIRVESQRFRDLASNRKEARKLLTLKLDELHNSDLSKRAVRIALEQKRKKRAAQKSRKKLSKIAEDDSVPEPHETDGDSVRDGKASGSSPS